MVIPQSEHARFAGLIAGVWGNANVAAPPLPLESFALGVVIHDRGYGPIDTMGIGEVDDSTWLATQRRGIETRSSDPVVDTVALMHLRRLVSSRDTEESRALVARADDRIAANLELTEHLYRSFERADTITQTCDMIAFHFSFEEPDRSTHAVDSKGARIDIAVELHSGGRITLDPWPLGVDRLPGFVLAYELAGYPDHLEPVLVPYTVEPEMKGEKE